MAPAKYLRLKDADRGPHERAGVTRRALLGAALFGAGSLLPAAAAEPASPAPEYTPQFLAAYAKFGDAAIPDGPVKLEVPDLAENGNMVPFTVSAESPMTADAYVESLTILSTGNPQPVIATFYLTPASGRALVSGRLRLARTQTLIAVAKLNTGALIKGSAKVEVNIGGCGAG